MARWSKYQLRWLALGLLVVFWAGVWWLLT